MDAKRWIAGGAIALAIVGAGTGFAIAAGGDDRPLTGSDLEKATAAALAHTGDGTVVEAETGEGGSAYGVEIRRADGTVVEVALDARFRVIGTERDDDTGAGDAPEGGPGDD